MRRPVTLPTISPGQWILAAILTLGAILRFQNLDAIQHNVDHAYPIWQAMMTLDRGALPVTAQGTSVLFANPALTGYLFIPWVALTRSPFGPYVFVIVLNTLAVFVAYRAALLLLDERRALIAAFLMAVNPWVVEYSRATWVQALIPLFVCLLFWLLIPVLLGTAEKPGRRTILAALVMTAMTQMYLLAFAILIPLVLLLVIFRKRVPWRSAAIGALIFAVPAIIYALGLAANSAETLSRVREFSSGQGHLSIEAWSHAVRLVSGQNYPVVRGMDAWITDWVLREYLTQAAHFAILAGILVGIGSAAYAIYKREQPQCDKAIIVLIWFATPILLMSYVSKPVHPFYMMLTLPAGSILAVWRVDKLFKRRILTPALAGLLVYIGVLFSVNSLRFSENTLALPGTYKLGALPVGLGRAMVQTLLPDETRKPGAVVFADVDEWTLNSLAGHLFPVDRSIDVSHTTFVPEGGATYFLFGGAERESDPPAWSSDQRLFSLGDGTYIRRYQVSRNAIPGLVGSPIKGDKGISYLGAQILQPPQAGSSMVLYTYWHVDDLPPERGTWLFGPFVHVYDSTGKRVAIGDGAVIPGGQWRLGDIQIQRLSVAIPADAKGPFTLQLGQYDGVQSANVIFTLPDGTASATVAVKP